MKESSERALILYDDIVGALRAAGLKEGQAVFAHASLSAFGFIVGGAETVIRAILEVIGSEGTIMMPAQTWKNLDPATGVHWEEPEEWWPLLREHWPAYDPAVTPSIGMGAVAEMLRTWPGAKRSSHPARSVCAVGKHAEYLTENHDLSDIFGDDSPVGRLYRMDGQILLFGVGYDKNTSIHLGEYRAEWNKPMTTEWSAIMRDGQRERVSYETIAVDDSDFIALGEAWESEKDIKPVKLGSGKIRCFGQRAFVDWSVPWITRNRRVTDAGDSCYTSAYV